MSCKICSLRKSAMYRSKCRQRLCTSCFITTPKKISYDKFKIIYFNSNDNITKDIVKIFYTDYLISIYTIVEYIQQTSKKII